MISIGNERGAKVVLDTSGESLRQSIRAHPSVIKPNRFELAELEVPAVPALVLNGSTLHAYEGFRFTVFPRSGGRAPTLDDPRGPDDNSFTRCGSHIAPSVIPAVVHFMLPVIIF